MEGLAGVDRWDQCYPEDENSEGYQFAREQLTAEANAAAAGCFDAGATEVWVLDGHGYNEYKGFIPEKLDPRIRCVRPLSDEPRRWEGLDETVSGMAIIGQHAMAGTMHGFIEHTGSPKVVMRHLINAVEHGEPGRLALYAGHYGVPLIYMSGDEALCEESRRLFPHALTTPTKKGTGFETCELYPPEDVRMAIRADIARAVRGADPTKAWKPEAPITLETEFTWTGPADRLSKYPCVERLSARTVRWRIWDARDVLSFPSDTWEPSGPAPDLPGSKPQ